MANWLNTAVFYEIYPQSFQDSNGDGIGDFQGIIRRLDYIQELGCNAIWMNPCFDSPFYDAGYDVRNFYEAAPRYGTNEDLRQLFEEVHKRGMHILLDLVAGHTSIDHPWFKASGLDEQNDYTDRYIWKMPEPDEPKFTHISHFISGIAERPGKVACNCFSTQPALNYGFGEVTAPWQFAADSPQAQSGIDLLKDIMSFWLKMGCDGFRVDMAHSLVKNDPDNVYITKLWRQIRSYLDDQFPEAVLVSEWGEPSVALNAGFHMDFLLHFGESHYMDLFREKPYFSAKGDGDFSLFAETYMKLQKSIEGTDGLICIPSGNHDMIRMAKTLTEEEMKLAFAFLLTMPGCPFIYYGDEIALPYKEGLKSKEGGYERTGSRTPMQWNDGVNAGFSAASKERLYLPQQDGEQTTVEKQMNHEDSLWHSIRKLIQLRQAHPALLARGAFSFVQYNEGAKPVVYERRAEQETITIVLNPSAKEHQLDLHISGELLFACGAPAYDKGGSIIIPPGSFTMFIQS